MAKQKQQNTPAKPETIVQTDYCDEMSSSFVDYAVSVITDRALPDVRDGLKPVHRRILYDMYDTGIRSNVPYKKVAKVVGNCLGRWHPHGDASVEAALVHMGQPWCYNYPYIDGQGNYGSIEGDASAASRYIECRLTPIAEQVLLDNINLNTVDWKPNYDDTLKEPTVLPAKLPAILITGTEGIAVGMAAKMPTHNLGEVVDAAVAVLDYPKISDEEIMKYLKGPDFATGGIVVNKDELTEVYKTGQGRIRVRGKLHVEDGEKGKKNIVVTEIPYTMIGAIDTFMDTVAELSRTKTMPDVTDIKNFSDKTGIRIVIELRKDADVDYNINVLYKKAKLEDTFGYNATLLSNGVPAVMPISRIYREYIAFYRETLTRKYKTLLDKETKSAEIKEGLIKAVDVIDTIIEALRGSKTVEMARKCLTKGIVEGINFKSKNAQKQASKLCFTENQATAILEMKMQKLVGLELDALTKEYNAHLKNIAEYTALLGSKTKMTNKMRSEMLALKEQFARPRKTEIVNAEAVVLKPQEVKAEQVCVLVNRFGYIRMIDEATETRNQANLMKDHKVMTHVMTTGTVYVFTDTGKCCAIKAQAIPMGKYTDKGVPVETLATIDKNDTVVSVVSDMNPKQKLVFATKLGFVKLVPVSEFITSRKTIDATKLTDKDKLILVKPIQDETVVMVTAMKFAVAFAASGVSTLKRNSVGIMGIKLTGNDTVEFADIGKNTVIINDKETNIADITGKRGTKGKLINL